MIGTQACCIKLSCRYWLGQVQLLCLWVAKHTLLQLLKKTITVLIPTVIIFTLLCYIDP